MSSCTTATADKEQQTKADCRGSTLLQGSISTQSVALVSAHAYS